MTETDTPLHVSFDDGLGPISNAWNVDQSVSGEVKLSGYAAMMEWASGPDAGHGYGTYTIDAKLEGDVPGPGIILWPGNDQWPGPEIDMVEITPDGSGRQYGTVHWSDGGSDAYLAQIYDGVEGGVFHQYQMVWEPGQITFLVDGAEKATVTDNVPADYDNGGMNNTIGFLNTSSDTAITVRDVSYTPLGGDGAASPTPPQPAASADPDPAGSAQQTSSDIVAAGSVTPTTTAIDWGAAAARVQEIHDSTGTWPILDTVLADMQAGSTGGTGAAPAPQQPAAATPVDWEAAAVRVEEIYDSTGTWPMLDAVLTEMHGAGGTGASWIL